MTHCRLVPQFTISSPQKPAGQMPSLAMQEDQASRWRSVAASWTVTGVPIEIGDVEADDEVEFVNQRSITIAIDSNHIRPGWAARGNVLLMVTGATIEIGDGKDDRALAASWTVVDCLDDNGGVRGEGDPAITVRFGHSGSGSRMAGVRRPAGATNSTRLMTAFLLTAAGLSRRRCPGAGVGAKVFVNSHRVS